MTSNYLENLTRRLTDAAKLLPDDVRRRHAAFLKSTQLEDGGFPGREGGSDLYYTGFALRGLALLDELDPDS
ncbi:MAG: geranyl transferase, partial [Planctomycetales bacterium]